jgi:hypothetical protein
VQNLEEEIEELKNSASILFTPYLECDYTDGISYFNQRGKRGY